MLPLILSFSHSNSSNTVVECFFTSRYMTRNNESQRVGQFFLLTRLGTKTRNRVTNSLELKLEIGIEPDDLELVTFV